VWEVLPVAQWTFDRQPGCGRLANDGSKRAEIFLRPCDTMIFALVPGAPRAGRFFCGLLAGFEYIRVEVDLTSGTLAVYTHEFHKTQPRLVATVPTKFTTLALHRERDELLGLPYEGCKVILLLDSKSVAVVGEIDYLPESLANFGLLGPGEFSLASWSMTGPPRPRPEYVHVGAWQKGNYATIDENMDALLDGVRKAAEVGVVILATPETLLIGLRPGDPDCDNRELIQRGAVRFQREISRISNAPYTLFGNPEWISGRGGGRRHAGVGEGEPAPLGAARRRARPAHGEGALLRGRPVARPPLQPAVRDRRGSGHGGLPRWALCRCMGHRGDGRRAPVRACLRRRAQPAPGWRAKHRGAPPQPG